MTKQAHPMLLNVAGLPGVPATEVGRLFGETDWAATELGPIGQWPQSLRTAVSICLNSRFPMFVWWGPNLVNIYNDAYAPMMGKRHPQGMGRSAHASWDDIWSALAPQVDAVMQRGEASWNERVPLVTERKGFAETAWFTWSYSPIYQEDGTIGGLFCAVSEETARVNAELERDRLIAEAQDAARFAPGSTMRPGSSPCCAGRTLFSRWSTRPITSWWGIARSKGCPPSRPCPKRAARASRTCSRT
jgi:hypothetical protein